MLFFTHVICNTFFFPFLNKSKKKTSQVRKNKKLAGSEAKEIKKYQLDLALILTKYIVL